MQLSNATIESWLKAYLGDVLDIPQDDVGVTTPFENFGLDSAAVVALTSDLSKWIGMELKSDLLFQYQDIQSVVGFITDKKMEQAI